jgi:hypothetical protein
MRREMWRDTMHKHSATMMSVWGRNREFSRSCRVSQRLRSSGHEFEGQAVTITFLVSSCLIRRFNRRCESHGLLCSDDSAIPCEIEITMATPSKIEANQRIAQESTGPRTREGKDWSRFHAVKQGMNAFIPTSVVFQPVEPLAPIGLNAKCSTESPARAKFEIWQNEPNFVNITGTKSLNGDHREARGLDLNRGEGSQ